MLEQFVREGQKPRKIVIKKNEVFSLRDLMNLSRGDALHMRYKEESQNDFHSLIYHGETTLSQYIFIRPPDKEQNYGMAKINRCDIELNGGMLIVYRRVFNDRKLDPSHYDYNDVMETLRMCIEKNRG